MSSHGAGCTRARLAVASALLLVSGSVHLAAQTPSTQTVRPPVQGIVAEEGSYQPVAGATVTLVGPDIETRTGLLGSFSFSDVPAGPATIRVTAPGHPSVTQEVSVQADRVVFVQFLLPTVSAMLAEVLVEAGARTDAADAQAETAADLVAKEVPSLRWRRTDIVRGYSTAVRLRGVSSVVQSLEPMVFLDDNRLASSVALEVLTQIPASQVVSVEVLRGPAASFLYPNAANGVIVIKTKR